MKRYTSLFEFAKPSFREKEGVAITNGYKKEDDEKIGNTTYVIRTYKENDMLFESKDIDKTITWVVTNYNQYKKVL